MNGRTATYFFRDAMVAGIAFTLLAPTAIHRTAGAETPTQQESLDLVKTFLKAHYARDYRTVYRYISSRDQRVWSEASYASQHPSFSGFALELAKRLAEEMKISVINRQVEPGRIHYEVGYVVPTADELSHLTFDWDQEKLNALSRFQQEQVLQALAQLKTTGKMITLKGQESIELILESGRWKIFYDWGSANKVKLNVAAPRRSAIQAQLTSEELIVKNGDPFEVSLKIANRGQVPASLRLVHDVRPRFIEKNLEMIACGALLPVTLQPGESQEVTMAYVLTGIPSGRQIELSYRIEPEAARSQTTTGRTSNKRLSQRAPEPTVSKQ